MSYSSEVLSKQDTHLDLNKWDGDDLTIRVWALLQLEEFIGKIGWIDHTNDWDLAYEITVGDQTYFSTDVVPLNKDGEPYTMDNGVNDHIVALRMDEWWDGEESSTVPKTIPLSEISIIYYGG